MPSFKSILCPVDFSGNSRHALVVAADLAKSWGATLTIAHVWQPPLYGSPDAPVAGTVIQSLVDDAERMLDEWQAAVQSDGLEIARTKITTGVPWHEILELAKGASADLIVMGTHGRTGLKHVLIGSVAEKVVRHATCDVLVVRGSQPSF